MKLTRLTKTILTFMLVIGAVFLLTSCGKKAAASTTTVPTESTLAATTATPTTAVTVPAISGTLPANTIQTTWVENAIDPAKTMYVHTESDFLRIRSGPGTDYQQVGSLVDGMTVSVVALTDTNWYKLADGYYVSGDYLTAEQ